MLVRTDNLADVHIINRQSTKSAELLPLLRSIYATCAHFNIAIRAEHLPGELNTIADHLSRPELHKHEAFLRSDQLAHPLPVCFVCSSWLELARGLEPAVVAWSDFSTSA